jgi:phosphonopyruvate decarboxylase
MSIAPEAFYEALATREVTFFTGVPDSLLKDFCAFVDAALPAGQHIIAANEGSAIALATGRYLATGQIPFVYLQNSGIGNTINPLMSLADPEVYSIPMVVMIGWRGAPGVKDEPQHVKQGRVTEALLAAMEVPYQILGPGSGIDIVDWAIKTARQNQGPVVLLVHKGTFAPSSLARDANEANGLPLTREEAIALLIDRLGTDTTIVATTGMISRELYEQRKLRGHNQAQDFLTVGSMGHASQIAHGIALAAPDNHTICIDGDGAALMHLGGMATIGTGPRLNMLHIVLNNGAHDSVGGQPTAAFDISLIDIAKACGYSHALGPCTTATDIEAALNLLAGKRGPNFLEIRIRRGSRADLGRPTETPVENRIRFETRLRNLVRS